MIFWRDSLDDIDFSVLKKNKMFKFFIKNY